MTTPSNHDDILDAIQGIFTLLKWISIPAVTGIALMVGSLVIDHFDQISLRQDSDYMRPKVTRLWIERHPELQDNR